MDVTVESGDWEVSSSSESEEEIIAGLKQAEGDEEHKTDDEKASDAASELGKRGGEAAAKAKAQKAKAEAKAKPADSDDESDGDDESKTKEGKPRDNPIARMKQATQQLAQERRENEALRKRLENLESLAQRITRPQEQQPQGQGDQRQPAPQHDGVSPAMRDWLARNPEPKSEDYEYHDYLSKRQEWVGRRAAREEAEAIKVEQEHQRIATEYQANVDRNVKSFVNNLGKGLTERGLTVADLPAWMGDLEATEFTGRPTPKSVVADMFFQSEDPAGLALYADEHMDEFQEILNRQTSYPRLVNALARFEAKALSGNGNGSKPQRRPAAKDEDDAGWLPAPPVRAISGSAAPSADSDDLNDDEALSRIMHKRYGRR